MPEIAISVDPRCLLRIVCAEAVVEKIRRAALAGNGAGMGTGGLLLGEREGSRVRVLDAVEIACSHSFGPPFRLTPGEARAARESILAPGALPVIGWYFSRLGGELELSGAELDLFGELFPTQWQITLLLIPRPGGKVRASFFFRDAAGALARGSAETLYPRHFQDAPLPVTRKGGRGILNWVVTAVLSLMAGAGLFLWENRVIPQPPPSPTPATQIP